MIVETIIDVDGRRGVATIALLVTAYSDFNMILFLQRYRRL